MRNKFFILLGALLGVNTFAHAAANGDQLIQGIQNDTVMIIAFSVVIVVLLAILATLYVTLYMIISQNTTEEVVQEGSESSFWTWFYSTFNAAAPLAKEKDLMLAHDYDGIRELDNDLPPWWKYMFYFTIVFGFAYMYYYHGSTPRSSIDEYKTDVAEAKILQSAYLEKLANSINETNVVLATDASALANGKTIFLENCKTCHGDKGQGLSGPNLTDNTWINGCDIKDIYKTVKYGVQAKGMLAWQSKLTPKQMQEVASYIVSLKGTNPEGAKEAQGTECVATK